MDASFSNPNTFWQGGVTESHNINPLLIGEASSPQKDQLPTSRSLQAKIFEEIKKPAITQSPFNPFGKVPATPAPGHCRVNTSPGKVPFFNSA
jgi:hypothetical protein